MSKLARDHRNTDLAKIHVAKKQLAMTQEDYEAIVKAVGRAPSGSSKDLDHAGRQRVLDHMRACGFKAKRPATDSQSPQRRKIAELWGQLAALKVLNDPTPAGLDKFINGRFGVSAERFLSNVQAVQVTEALKAWLKRATSKA